jgi:D-alanyl-D-alanine carboxypeptidase/D-alanyl-D-alanine-endopeptidase (penicillin-binding protein 4)
MLRCANSLLLAGLCGLAGASELSIRLDKALSSIPEGGQSGVAVYDFGSDTWLYLAGSNDPLALASTTKLLTTVAAYHFLGPQFQFVTRVVALGQPQNGSVPGIGVIGGGDPCFDEHFYEDDPEAPFAQWAKHLKEIGVTRVDGDVVVDGRLFSGPIRPATYPQDAENQQRWYSAPASAFAWNDNCIEVRVVPTVAGHPAEVQTRPQTPLVQARNLTRTVSAKSEARSAVNRDPNANAVTVSGTYAKTSAWFPLAIATDPDLLAGEQLKHELVEAGIDVSGTVRLGAVTPDGLPLLIEQRHDLQPALTLMNQHSQNFYAEQMLRMVGAQRSGTGSIESGCAAVMDALQRLLGKDAESVHLLDGSGLSYDNRASAATMVKMLVAMQRTPVGEPFLGTLKSKDEGRARGYVKTGTHAVACCLVGYIDLPSGHRIAFAELLNRGDSNDIGWAYKLRDTIFKILCESAER